MIYIFFIYFAEFSEYIKIGVTHNLRSRMHILSNKAKEHVILLGYECEPDRLIAHHKETSLHHKFYPPLEDALYIRECFPKLPEIYKYIQNNCIYYDEILYNINIHSFNNLKIKPYKIWIRSIFHGEPCYISFKNNI